MATENEISSEIIDVQGGRITFAPDVIATIANLAAAEIDGVDGMSGNVAENISGMLNSKKNLTKGVRVEVSEDVVSVELAVIVKYGYKIHEVCHNIQRSIKNAIETMTGLRVLQVNVSVQSISFEKGSQKKAESPAEPQ
ncbi:MAG TPA: Asp23/Gls24 family envelope stress response protein [Clostridia bacterium]|nr:MAG: Alkaline shock protein 23 [Firmicutes bacterium ADurb.Bin248]HOG00365.1 Asp23/Gls24 family envelope stress response protein [Clostridia bacterium]HOS19269.1 Asp23/Gls24 family envelope stress response protein [Clostridia bacterium]HPK15603.1 Asp23/Gls24 family envelope stress response protein [Clostridia bacterium]